MKTITLQEQIAELTAKHDFEQYINSILPNIDTLIIYSTDRKRVVIRAKSKDEFKTVLNTLPATGTTHLIGSATKHEKELQSPYRIDIDNPCSPNSYSKFQIDTSYTSKDIEVSIELPIETVTDFVTMGKRGITDSEYHYFVGVSHAELRRMQVCAYSFKAEQISWYGGNKTLLSEEEINNIISFLSK